MRFSVRRLHVCPVQEKRTLRNGAFCAGTLTEKRILNQRRHGKAHFGCDLSLDAIRPHGKVYPALHALRVTVPHPACRTLLLITLRTVTLRSIRDALRCG